MTNASTYTYEIDLAGMLGGVTRARGGKKVVQEFLSVDPLMSGQPQQSPYVYAANSPIQYIDAQGLIQIHPDEVERIRRDYPNVYNLVMGGSLETYVRSNPDIVNILVEVSGGRKNAADVISDFTAGSGPYLNIRDLSTLISGSQDIDGSFGRYPGEHQNSTLELDDNIGEYLEQAVSQGDNQLVKAGALLVASGIIHEYTHLADGVNHEYQPGGVKDGFDVYISEAGHWVEEQLYGNGVSLDNVMNQSLQLNPTLVPDLPTFQRVKQENRGPGPWAEGYNLSPSAQRESSATPLPD